MLVWADMEGRGCLLCAFKEAISFSNVSAMGSEGAEESSTGEVEDIVMSNIENGDVKEELNQRFVCFDMYESRETRSWKLNAKKLISRILELLVTVSQPSSPPCFHILC